MTYVLWGVTPPGSYAPSAGYRCLDRHEWNGWRGLGSVPSWQEKMCIFLFMQGSPATSEFFFLPRSASQYFKERWREGSLKQTQRFVFFSMKMSTHASVTIRMPGLRVCIRNETDLPAISLPELLQHSAAYR